MQHKMLKFLFPSLGIGLLLGTLPTVQIGRWGRVARSCPIIGPITTTCQLF